jgi:exopolyphosphatase
LTELFKLDIGTHRPEKIDCSSRVTRNHLTMSRASMQSFLATAKAHLQQVVKQRGRAKLVIGNESADLDSITSALVYGYLQSYCLPDGDSVDITIPVTNIPSADLTLRPELTALLKYANIRPSELITLDDLGTTFLSAEQTQWTLVDHNVLQSDLGQRYAGRVAGVIDHHDDEKKVPRNASPRIIEKSGSCNSLIINHFRSSWQSSSSLAAADAQIAKLSLGAILIDTINMTDRNKVTPHDEEAVQYLEAKVATSTATADKHYDREDFYNVINAAKNNIDDLSIYDILRKDYKQWTDDDSGLVLGTAAIVQNFAYLQSKDADLLEVCSKFATDRSLDLLAVMTASTSKSGEFGRELLLIACKEDAPVEAARHFSDSSKDELQLVDLQNDLHGPEFPFVHMWKQENLAASRKQVAPLLREAMSSSNAGSATNGKL